LRDNISRTVDQYLQRLVEDLRIRYSRAPFHSGSESTQAFYVVGAIKALHGVGMLSSDEKSEWMQRVGKVVNAPRNKSHAVADTTTTAAKPSATTTWDVEDSSALDLQRVVGGPFDLGNGLCLASVELYTDRVALRWNKKTVPAKELEEQLPMLELQDDLGTHYVFRRRRAGSGGAVLTGETYFSPAAPAKATWLQARVGKDRVRLSLRS
jgi:hypothetical protein